MSQFEVSFGQTKFIAHQITSLRPFTANDGEFIGVNVFMQYDKGEGKVSRIFTKTAPCTEEEFEEGLRQLDAFHALQKPGGDLLTKIQALRDFDAG